MSPTPKFFLWKGVGGSHTGEETTHVVAKMCATASIGKNADSSYRTAAALRRLSTERAYAVIG